MHFLNEVSKEIEAAIHRFHCWFFEDEYWCLDDYIDLYGPLVLFIAYEVLILIIAGIVH